MALLPILQPCLFEDTVERTGGQVVILFAGDGHAPGLRWVFELPMASSHGYHVPASRVK
jgi:hypothetical protein